MSETSTLIVYDGKINREELARVPTPPATVANSRCFSVLASSNRMPPGIAETRPMLVNRSETCTPYAALVCHITTPLAPG